MLAIVAAQLVRDREERAVKRPAIVIGQVDKSSLHDQPAKFDQLFGARSALHNPFSHVGPCLLRLKSMPRRRPAVERSEEHTSELKSLLRTSYAVLCLKKKNKLKLPNMKRFTTS